VFSLPVVSGAMPLLRYLTTAPTQESTVECIEIKFQHGNAVLGSVGSHFCVHVHWTLKWPHCSVDWYRPQLQATTLISIGSNQSLCCLATGIPRLITVWPSQRGRVDNGSCGVWAYAYTCIRPGDARVSPAVGIVHYMHFDYYHQNL